MTLEDKFNQTVWKVLRKIKEALLFYDIGDNLIVYSVHETIPGAMPITPPSFTNTTVEEIQEEVVLRKLFFLKIIILLEFDSELNAYRVKVDEGAFNNLYQAYKNGLGYFDYENRSLVFKRKDSLVEENFTSSALEISTVELTPEESLKTKPSSFAPYEVTYTNNEVWINTKFRSYKIKQTMDEKDPDLLMGYVIYHPGEEIIPKILNNYLSEKKLKSRPLKRSFPALISELGFMGDELKKAFFPTRDSDKVVFRKKLTYEDIKANNINEESLINQIIEAEKLCLESEQAKV